MGPDVPDKEVERHQVPTVLPPVVQSDPRGTNSPFPLGDISFQVRLGRRGEKGCTPDLTDNRRGKRKIPIMDRIGSLPTETPPPPPPPVPRKVT